MAALAPPSSPPPRAAAHALPVVLDQPHDSHAEMRPLTARVFLKSSQNSWPREEMRFSRRSAMPLLVLSALAAMWRT